MNISIYKNLSDNIGSSVDIWKFFTTDKWKMLSDQVRVERDKERRKELKKQLPCCTPSGLFRERKKDGLIQHSGFICVDIDGQDNPNISDWQGFVHELGHLNETAFAGLSVSGNGAFCLIPVSDTMQHERHFKAIEEDFLKYGIIIDHACKDVSRLRIYSNNSNPYINKRAQLYKRMYKQKPIKNNFNSKGGDVEKLIQKVVGLGVNIVPDYLSWFEVAGALANVPNGRELFHAISRVDSTKYNQRDCDRQFDHVKSGAGISINTLFYHSKINGVTLK